MNSRKKRDNVEKIALFRAFFSGLDTVFGTYDPVTGRSWQVKEPVTDNTILAHLLGRRPYGVYLLMGDRTRAIVADFDHHDFLPPVEYLNSAKHYGLSAYMEVSKSKGFHVWIFFTTNGVKTEKARVVVKHILQEIEQTDVEIFPKQDFLHPETSFGNFINAPLFGGLVPEKKTVFVDPRTLEPYPDQWEFLDSIERTDEDLLDDIITINGFEEPEREATPAGTNGSNGERSGPGLGLPPCIQKILAEGVSRYQRVVCFRLAVAMKKMGMPYDMAIAILKSWALKNKPEEGKEIIQESAILEQASYAYTHFYSGYGCGTPAMSPFCDPSCRVRLWRENNNKPL
jgi:hypothetical protein